MTPATGTLRTWDEERGFGFIAPRDGGRELFVHISAFPRDGSRPTAGERVIYEVGPGRDGRPCAVRAWRQAIGSAGDGGARRARRAPRRSPLMPVVALVLVAALGGYGYHGFRTRSASPTSAGAPVPAVASEQEAAFRCDGRRFCSEMTSCREAKFFLNHCPDTMMDGNHDGVPCEQQWCTSLFAR